MGQSCAKNFLPDRSFRLIVRKVRPCREDKPLMISNLVELIIIQSRGSSGCQDRHLANPDFRISSALLSKENIFFEGCKRKLYLFLEQNQEKIETFFMSVAWCLKLHYERCKTGNPSFVHCSFPRLGQICVPRIIEWVF